MENKFLPIGSVCTLKGKNKKVMITGYYGVEFNGNLKFDDYQGCAYPEGMLLPEFVCNFNHSDIEQVDFVGFKNDEQNKFKILLDRLTGNNNEEQEYKNEDWSLVSNNSYSKLLFDENGVVVLAEPIVKQTNTKNQIKFDENGIVIEDDDSIVQNPFYKEYLEKKSNDTPSNNIFSNYEFDENGVVTNVEENRLVESNLNKIEFDENGIVIDVKEEKPTKQYKFDENGILIAVEEEIEEEIPPIGPGLPGYVAPVVETPAVAPVQPVTPVAQPASGGFQFDANGNVIAAPTPETSTTEGEGGEAPATPNFQFDENGTVISA